MKRTVFRMLDEAARDWADDPYAFEDRFGVCRDQFRPSKGAIQGLRRLACFPGI
jgi:hypothetical protein